MEQSTDFKYLKHLARRGTPYIHPKGFGATRLLIEKLNISPGDRLLEFGCGTGATLCKIASDYDVNIEAVDVLEEMVKSANERIKAAGMENNTRVRKISRGEKLPFDDDSFEKAYAESVLGFQTRQEMENILKEIYRILRYDGLLAVNEALWKADIDGKTAGDISNQLMKHFGLSFASHDNISLRKFIKIAEGIGFKIIEEIDINYVTNRKSDNNETFGKKLVSIRYVFDEVRYRFRMSQFSKYNNCIESYLIVMAK